MKRSFITVLLYLSVSFCQNGLSQNLPEDFVKLYSKAKTSSEQGKILFEYFGDNLLTNPKTSNLLLAYFVENNDPFGTDFIKLLINSMRNNTGEYTNSLKESYEILSRFEKRKDRYGQMWAIATLANTFIATKNFDSALVFYKRELPLAKELNDSLRYVNIINDIGFTYYLIKKPDSGIVYAKRAIDIAEQYNYPGYLKYPLSTLGENYIAKGAYDTALSIFRKLQNYTFYDTFFIAGLYNDFAECFMALNKRDSAIHYANLLIKIANENNLKPNLLRLYENLSDFFNRLNDTDSSNKYFRLATIIKDSLYNIEKIKITQQITFDDGLRRNEELQQRKALENKIKLYALLGGIVLFLTMAILLYRNNLQKQKAKVKIEKAYNELKATQQQLIQSEKMASLGELTAGIAHEIQNPLNFVNNFSEVNDELINELVDEVDKGNYDEVKSIAKDIKDNSEKINHHGKRADAIVKGMLQHSKTSTGQKELTDINKLADEYLRLSYHGMRAKDKSFNAVTKTDFDDSIGNINVVPQDIGRVLLNLYNNAFYAVNEKQKQNLNGYQPAVTIATAKHNGKVEIKIKDNGNGIPQNLVDKIFQPFFTTKPTGQGTGLGLSLAYDIVTKGHGGELKVETKDKEGSSFIIQLPA